MKKFLALLMTSASLLVACGNNSSPSEPSEPADPPVTPYTPNTLTFIEAGKIRIDIFDVTLHINYGNSVITQSNTVLDIDDKNTLSLSGTDEHDEANAYYVALVAENKEGVVDKAYLGIECESAVEGLNDNSVFTNFFKGYDRGYVAFSKGKQLRWTRGLSTTLDAALEVYIQEK